MGSTGPVCLLLFGAALEISNTFCKLINYCHVRKSFHISGVFVSSENLCFYAFFFSFFLEIRFVLTIEILLARGKSERSHESISLHIWKLAIWKWMMKVLLFFLFAALCIADPLAKMLIQRFPNCFVKSLMLLCREQTACLVTAAFALAQASSCNLKRTSEIVLLLLPFPVSSLLSCCREAVQLGRLFSTSHIFRQWRAPRNNFKNRITPNYLWSCVSVVRMTHEERMVKFPVTTVTELG